MRMADGRDWGLSIPHFQLATLGLVQSNRDAVASVERRPRSRTGRLQVQPRLKQRVCVQQPPRRAMPPVEHEKDVRTFGIPIIERFDHGALDRLGRIHARQVVVGRITAERVEVVELQQAYSVFPESRVPRLLLLLRLPDHARVEGKHRPRNMNPIVV